MTDRELMQQALDALEEAADHVYCPGDDDAIGVARKALRARLAQPEPEPVATLFGSLPVYDVPPKQEPVAWMHNFIDEVVIAHRPVDLDRHPDRWTPLYKDPTPCQTCEALARTVMMDQVSYDIPPRHREPPTQDLSAPLTVNGVPMYPQREWQGLTRDEVSQIWSIIESEGDVMHEVQKFARAIEAKLKEKNT